MIDAVILDVGGVLLVPHFGVVGSALGVALTSEDAERAHYRGVHAMDLADDEPAARHAYLVAYVQAIQADHLIHDIARLWSGSNLDLWQQHVSGSREGLRRLATTGKKLGIVSNADGTIEEQLRRSEICQVGEGLGVPVLAIIDSGVVGVSKPAADIFRHALEPLAVEPHHALYVGDTMRYDVTGARAAGLTPVHFDPLELCPARDDHAHVVVLAEVEPLLDRA